MEEAPQHPNDRLLDEIKLIYKLGKWVFGSSLGIGVTAIVVLVQGNARLEQLQKWQERTVPLIETIPLIARDVSDVRGKVEIISPRVESMWWSRTNRY